MVLNSLSCILRKVSGGIFVVIIEIFLLSFNHYDLKSLLQQEKTKEDTHQTTLLQQTFYFLLFLCLLLG